MYREENSSKLIPFITAALLTAVTAVLLAFKFGFILEINDDIALRNIASGAFTGKPDAHLIYIMYPLGLIFKGLYSLAGNISWYDIFMVGMHFVCIFLIIYRMGTVFKQLSNRLVSMIMSLSILLIFELSFIVLHQYTILAGIMMGAGLLWLTTVDYSVKSKSDAVIILILFILALWVRKQVFFMGIPLVVLALIFNIFEKNDTLDERYERFMKTLIPLIVGVVLVGASFGAEFIAYSSPVWKSFKAFNEARTDVYDFNGLPDYYTNTEFYEGLGISEAEYTVLREYDIVLSDKADTALMAELKDKAEKIAKEWARFYSVPRKIINDTVFVMYSKNNTPLAISLSILFFVLFVYFMVQDRKLAGTVVLLTYGFEWAFVGYFTYLERLPERVTHAFFMMEFLFLIAVFVRAIIRTKNLRTPSLYWQIMAGAFFALIFIFTGLHAYRETSDKLALRQQDITEWVEINRYFKDNPEKVYVLNTAVYANSAEEMFPKQVIDAYNTVTSNWTHGGPLQAERCERLGIESVSKALKEQDNVFFVQSATKETVWLESYFGSAEICDTVTLSDGASYNIISVK